jgi:hypothetical protein
MTKVHNPLTVNHLGISKLGAELKMGHSPTMDNNGTLFPARDGN